MIVILFIFGLFIGSFLNMLIDRMPREEQVVAGRSHCDHCNHVLSWTDLVPVVSWMILRGKCRYCHKSVPFRNTLVELITGTMFVGIYILYGSHLADAITMTSNTVFGMEIAQLVLYLIIVSCLIVIFFIDLDHKIIPDSLTIIASIAAVLIHILMHLLEPGILQSTIILPPLNYVLAAVGASLFFAFLIFITKGRGMGWGDVKFAFFMGLFLGYPRIVFSLYFAFLTGAFLSAILIVRRRKKFGQTIPFGPFLVLGTLFAAVGILDIAWQHIFGSLLQ